MPTRRFEAGFDVILRDLRATFRRMEPTAVTIELGGTFSKNATLRIERIGWAVSTQQPALLPSGAAVGFRRDGRDYRFACTNYIHPLDNLRAAQRAVSLLYTIYDEYAVTEGSEMADQAAFDRLFGGHLALGDGTPAAWWVELGVSPTASREEIDRAFRRLAHQTHPDKPGGSHAAMLRLQAAYEQALAAIVPGATR